MKQKGYPACGAERKNEETVYPTGGMGAVRV